MCVICHTEVSSSNPPLKSFPTKFNESFNVKFDHAQHNTGSARPQSGCADLSQPLRRARGCRTLDSGKSVGPQSVLLMPHAEQQICQRPRNRIMRRVP